MHGLPGKRFTATVRSRERHGKTYGRIELENLDLVHLAGQKVHVLILTDEEYRQLMDTLQGEANRDLCSELNELEEAIEELFSPGSVIDVALSMYEEKRRQELALRTVYYRKRSRKGKTEEIDIDKIEVTETQDVKTRIQELKKKLEDLKRKAGCKLDKRKEKKERG